MKSCFEESPLKSPFKTNVSPNWEAYEACLMRHGTPKRAHLVELFLDQEIKDELVRRFELDQGLPSSLPHREEALEIRLQRFLGYDYVSCGAGGAGFPLTQLKAADTAALARGSGRAYVDETRGPVASWEDFEAYPWPDPGRFDTRALEWYEKNLPEDMCVAAWGVAEIYETISFLMGYQTLCESLYEEPELVRAVAQKARDYAAAVAGVMSQFKRVRFIFGSDDMGFRSGLFVRPETMAELVLPGHKRVAEIAHAAGKRYLLHSCGKIDRLMDALIDEVKIDAKHSFEDTIEDVGEAKLRYGNRVALLGGIDVDFLCRAPEQAIRARVRETLKRCLPGGGYALGSGNSIANYVPVDSYLAMLDEARNFAA